MKTLGILLDMIYDSITFFPGFYTYLETSLSFTSSKPIKMIKKISKVKQQYDITPNHIMKKGSIKNLNDFLKTTGKIIKKKRQLANVFK